MPSRLLQGLKRGLVAVLIYGIIFSYPTWTLFGRVAYASPKDPPEPRPVPSAPPTAGTQDGDSGAPKRGGLFGGKKRDRYATPGETHSGNDAQIPPPGIPGTGEKKEKEIPSLPHATSCSDDNFYLNATKGTPEVNAAPLCTEGVPMTDKCWKQVYTLLGAADSNAFYYNNPETSPEKGTAPLAATENSLIKMQAFTPALASKMNQDFAKEDMFTALDLMSNPEVNKDINHQECCLQLVDKARGVGEYIKTHASTKKEFNLKPSDREKFDQMFADQEAKCRGEGAAVVVPKEKEKKKRNWWLIGGLIALLIGGLIWAFSNKKKKKKKTRRPTEKPKPCKGKKCGGGGGGASGSASTGGTVTGGTTGTVTGNTYPSTTGDTGPRDVTTTTGGNTAVETTGDNPGRDTTTGEGGTVTGSTTATTGTDTTTTTTTTGNTYPSGGDGPGRTTAGDSRPVAPSSRTLMNNKRN